MILFIFIWSCTSSWQDLGGGEGGVKLYYQLTYLVDFANFYYVLLYILLFCTPSCNLTLFGIILYFQNTFEFFFLLFGLVSLASRISGGLERTTSQRCSLHFQSTLPNCKGSLLILLFWTPNQSTLIQSITFSQQDLRILRKYLKCSLQYASCTSSWQYFLNLLRSYQLEVQDQIKINVNILL